MRPNIRRLYEPKLLSDLCSMFSQPLTVDEAHKCKYPDCDGGPAAGYCHETCRDVDQERRA